MDTLLTRMNRYAFPDAIALCQKLQDSFGGIENHFFLFMDRFPLPETP